MWHVSAMLFGFQTFMSEAKTFTDSPDFIDGDRQAPHSPFMPYQHNSLKLKALCPGWSVVLTIKLANRLPVLSLQVSNAFLNPIVSKSCTPSRHILLLDHRSSCVAPEPQPCTSHTGWKICTKQATTTKRGLKRIPGSCSSKTKKKLHITGWSRMIPWLYWLQYQRWCTSILSMWRYSPMRCPASIVLLVLYSKYIRHGALKVG